LSRILYAAIWIDLAPAGVDVTRYPQKSLCTDEGGPAPKDGFRPCDQFCLATGGANSSQTRESTNFFPTRSKAASNYSPKISGLSDREQIPNPQKEGFAVANNYE